MMTRVILTILLVLLLAGCAEPAYTPDPATLAAREAQEYQTRLKRGEAAWRVGLGATIVLLIILCVLVGFLSQVRYRIADAQAKAKEAEARRLLLVDLGGGAVFDLKTNTIHKTSATNVPPVSIAPVMAAAPLAQSPEKNGNPYLNFLITAARSHPDKWRGATIPRWEKMGIRSEDWQRITDVLVGEELIEKSQGRETTIIDGTLGSLYHLLLSSPIDD